MLYETDFKPSMQTVPARAKGAPSIWEREAYKPPKDTPTRPGALDASLIPSLSSTGQATYRKGHQ